MDNEEKRQATLNAINELNKELQTVKRIFSYTLNGLVPIGAFENAIKRFQEKRQALNNLNQGILVGIGRFNIELFSLAGDPKKDGGQKNLSEDKGS